MNNLWHRINIDTDLQGVVEITNGSLLNTSVDNPTGLLRLNRIEKTPMPSNYGFIPQTLSDDNTPLNIFIFSSQWLPPLSIIPIVPERIIYATDGVVGKAYIVATVKTDYLEWLGAEKRTNLVYDYLIRQHKNIKNLTVLDHNVALTAIKIANQNYKHNYEVDNSKLVGG